MTDSIVRRSGDRAQQVALMDWNSPAHWWPLALESELADAGRKPIAVTLHSIPWALVTLDGEIAALKDLCPHRRVPLSAGVVADSAAGEVLECGYHGWAFDRSGACAVIPALGEGRAPRGMGGTPTISLMLHEGLVWGSADESADRSSILRSMSSSGVLLRAQVVMQPAADVAWLLAGEQAGPGAVLRLAHSSELTFAIRPETEFSCVVFPIVPSESFESGMQTWVQTLAALESAVALPL
ncbi:MAG: Rieske (2Fe-2S) domain protein [Subtercola sp.]|nr:Rieske (2Fe-2S) domain protein [Subtercola sp.]